MDDFDRLLDELIQVGHSPRGRYSAEKSWRLLERRMNPQEAYMRRFIHSLDDACGSHSLVGNS